MSIWGRIKNKAKKTFDIQLNMDNKNSFIRKSYTREYRGNIYTTYNGTSNYIYILDAGHGGIIDGVYQTEGKRSPKWEDGSQLYEGVSNRDIVNRISIELQRLNISHIILVNTEIDTPLKIRTDLANLLYNQEKTKSNKKMIYISVHSDAWKTKSARGWSVFTTPGQTNSDIIAEHFANKFEKVFRNERLRTQTQDGDKDFEARFWVLRKTLMPAILTENFFMTNPHECKNILMNNLGRQMIARIHYDSIFEIDRIKLIG